MAPLVPIVFVATGRSGSTLLMELLGTSPDVLFERVYAYERAYLTYLLHWARLPMEGPATADRWNRSSMDQIRHLAGGKLIGGIPWTERRLLAVEKPPLWVPLLRSSWRVLSERMRTAAGIEPPPRYYAETGPIWVPRMARRALPVRIGYLVRDPRDQMVSIAAFVARRHPSFGFRADDTPQSHAPRFVERQRQLLEAAVNPEPGTIVVRYEDLALDIAATAARLGSWLDIDLDPARVPAHLEHRTTPNVTASVARWRNELDPGVAAFIVEHLGDEMKKLGYE
jgi:Sulfotransferase family